MMNLLGNLTRSFTVGRPLWLLLLPALIVPLILFSYKSLAGPGEGPPGVRDPDPDLGRHRDRPGPGRGPVGPPQREADDDVRRRLLREHPPGVPGDDPLVRLGGLEEAEQDQGRPDRRDRLRQEPERRGAPGADRGEPRTWGSRARSTASTPTSAAPSSSPWPPSPRTPPGGSSSSPTATKTAATRWSRPLPPRSLGVQIDVLPVDYFYDKEVLVEKVSLPPDVKKGRRSTSTSSSAPPSRRRGRCRSSRRTPTTRSVPAPATRSRCRSTFAGG